MRFINSRRTFLKTSGLLAGSLLLSPKIFSEEKDIQKVRLAFVGLGSMGRVDLKVFKSIPQVEITTLCDADKKNLDAALSFFKDDSKNPQLFIDYREMFEKSSGNFDAVVIATPDHLHFTIAMTAAFYKKHIFVEKPMCKTIDQVHRLTQAAKEANVITQMGNQGQASPYIRKAKSWFDAGILGEIKEVHAWTNRPTWPQGMTKFPQKETLPESLNWDLWLGPTKGIEYSSKIAPFFWRGWQAFGTGALGDMGLHILNPVNFILECPPPIIIEGFNKNTNQISFPSENGNVNFSIPASQRNPAYLIKWFEGKSLPPRPSGLSSSIPLGTESGGSIFYGTKNTLIVGASGESLYLLKDFEKINTQKIPSKYPRVRGHIYRNWIESILKKTEALSNFDYSAPFTEMILLGTIAQTLGRKLSWNATTKQFENDEVANSLLKAPLPTTGFLA